MFKRGLCCRDYEQFITITYERKIKAASGNGTELQTTCKHPH